MSGTEQALSRKMSGGLFCIHIDVEANGNDETYSKRAGFTVRLSGVISCELSIEGDDPLRPPVLSECMVRRRVASEKRAMAVGLRQCIRPLVESLTPGHDGYPLALVPIMWTVW